MMVLGRSSSGEGRLGTAVVDMFAPWWTGPAFLAGLVVFAVVCFLTLTGRLLPRLTPAGGAVVTAIAHVAGVLVGATVSGQDAGEAVLSTAFGPLWVALAVALVAQLVVRGRLGTAAARQRTGPRLSEGRSSP